MTPVLELTAICKVYGAPDSPAALRVLDGISLRVEAGESLAVVGPSGCGKSTLLNIIGGLDRPTSGTVMLDGRDLGLLSEDALAGLRNGLIGFVFQQHHLLPQCTVLENVLLPTLATRRSRAQRQADAGRAEALLERVGLADRRNHRPGLLSGGESQRAAVVRALINRPRLLLADEPTGSLDHASARALGDLLVELNRAEGIALVVVTHSPELAGRMGAGYALADGRLTRDPGYQHPKPNTQHPTPNEDAGAEEKRSEKKGQWIG
jgi:lipoprotein-releasing system ATP-binding protein